MLAASGLLLGKLCPVYAYKTSHFFSFYMCKRFLFVGLNLVSSPSFSINILDRCEHSFTHITVFLFSVFDLFPLYLSVLILFLPLLILLLPLLLFLQFLSLETHSGLFLLILEAVGVLIEKPDHRSAFNLLSICHCHLLLLFTFLFPSLYSTFLISLSLICFSS